MTVDGRAIVAPECWCVNATNCSMRVPGRIPLESENPYDPPRIPADERSPVESTNVGGRGPAISIALGALIGCLCGSALLVFSIQGGFLGFVPGAIAGGLYYRLRSRRWPVDESARTRRYFGALLATLLLPTYASLAFGTRGQGLQMTILMLVLGVSIAVGILISGDHRPRRAE